MSELAPLPSDVIQSISSFIKLKKDAVFSERAGLLRDDVFSVLEKQCNVLYYPLPCDEENDGFHIQKVVNGKIENFVFINTYKVVEKQIFTAAHELGHILKLAEYLKEHCNDYSDELEENAMNQFAAQILMPKNIFINNAKNHFAGNDKFTVPDFLRIVVSLMNDFFVPYKAVIWRLCELEFLSYRVGNNLFDSGKEKIPSYISENPNLRLNQRSQKKSIKDFAALIEKAEADEYFPKQRINRIREVMGIKTISENKGDATIYVKLGGL